MSINELSSEMSGLLLDADRCIVGGSVKDAKAWCAGNGLTLRVFETEKDFHVAEVGGDNRRLNVLVDSMGRVSRCEGIG